MKKIFILAILLTSIISFSQTTCDSLLLLKKKVYGFKPSEIDRYFKKSEK